MFIKIGQISIPFVWFGLLAGISFLEAPLKFRAPGITLALGLSVGRLVFSVLNKVELVLAATLLLSLVLQRPPKSRFPLTAFAIIGGLLLLETLWLLPVLDARATGVINGTAEPYSNTHIIYIAFDAIKFLLLFALGVNLLKQRLKITE